MEISNINNMGAAANKAFEISVKKPAPAGSGNSAEKLAPDTVEADFTKLENEIAAIDSKATEEFLQKMIDRANKQLSDSGREFSYSVHKRTGQFMIKVIDRETKEVVREIPPEKTLDAVAKMWDLMGIFVDEKT